MAPLEYFSSFAGTRGFTLFMILLQVLSGRVGGGKSGCPRDLEIGNHNVMHIENLAIKTIQSEDGDIIDCVDILRQPTLNHPLLKNHSNQMRPNFYDGELKSNLSSKLLQVKQIWQRSGSCPAGTVPFRRNTEEGLSKDFPFPRYSGEVASTGRLEFAGAHVSRGAPYYGIHGFLNVWSLYVEFCEFSLNYVDISDIGHSNYVRAGWGVHHQAFGDFKSRLFVQWKSNGNGCYNDHCVGFVKVSNTIVLGGTIGPLSTYDGAQYGMDVAILKYDSGPQYMWSWRLYMLGVYVGYWPLSLFSNLQSGSQLEWVGSVYNNNENGRHTSTQMGSGHSVDQGYRKTAFMANLQAMTSTRQFGIPAGIGYGATHPGCYNIRWPADGIRIPGTSFFYGGGGWIGCG